MTFSCWLWAATTTLINSMRTRHVQPQQVVSAQRARTFSALPALPPTDIVPSSGEHVAPTGSGWMRWCILTPGARLTRDTRLLRGNSERLIRLMSGWRAVAADWSKATSRPRWPSRHPSLKSGITPADSLDPHNIIHVLGLKGGRGNQKQNSIKGDSVTQTAGGLTAKKLL